MSAADLEVANYLAQRKAKKSSSKNNGKFKTFTATTAFMALEGGDNDLDEGVGHSGSSAIDGLVHGGTSPTANGSNAQFAGSAHHHQPTQSTLVAGEWIDDESQFASQTRLVTGGGQVVDLESLDLEDKRDKFDDSRRIQGLEKTSIWKTTEPVSKPSRDFPALESASAPAAVSSVWGNRAPQKAEPREEEPVKAAEEPKSNVWRPKSVAAAQAGGNAPKANVAAPSAPKAAPPPPKDAPAGGNFVDNDGLRRSANAWKPRRGNE